MNSIIGDDDLQFDSNDLHLTVGEFGTNIVDTDINSSFFDNNIGTVIVIVIVTIAIIIVILIIYIIYR